MFFLCLSNYYITTVMPKSYSYSCSKFILIKLKLQPLKKMTCKIKAFELTMKSCTVAAMSPCSATVLLTSNSSAQISTWIILTSGENLGGFPKCKIQFSRAPRRRMTSAFCNAKDLYFLKRKYSWDKDHLILEFYAPQSNGHFNHTKIDL